MGERICSRSVGWRMSMFCPKGGVMDNIRTITASELQERIDQERPDNRDPGLGYALVNVLAAEQYEEEHVPYSMNVPLDRIGDMVSAFDEDKEIIVYCGSKQCDASERAARRLQEMGFVNVIDFAGGMDEWKRSGGRVISGQEERSGAWGHPHEHARM